MQVDGSNRITRARGRNRLPGPRRRRCRRLGRRGLLHDRHGGLRAGGHRPELRRQVLAFAPARRQLRRRRAAAGVEPRLDRGRRDAALPACAGRPGSRRRASWRSRRSTRARSCGALRCEGRDALRARRGVARRAARACAGASRTSTGERVLAEPELASPPPALVACGTPSRTPSGPVRASSFSTSAASARSSAGSSEPGSRASSCPRAWDADAVLELEPGGGPGRQRPGRPRPARRTRSRPCVTCSAQRRSSASASATSSLGLALGLNTFKLPFGHRGANHPVRVTRLEPRARDRPEPRLRRRAGDARRGQPRLAQRRHGRGARGRRLRRRCSSTPRLRPARTTPFPSSTGSPTACRSAPTFEHPDRRIRADPDRPGLRVRLRRRAGLPGAACRGLPRRARRTRTPPRS